MSIIQYPQALAGEIGVIGATKFMVTTDSLSTLTTAAYLNNIDLAVYPIHSYDVLSVLYDYNLQTQTGTLGVFRPSISNGVITLSAWANPGNVLLPVVDGHFASFNGTSGQIKDSGIVASNPAKPKVASINAATINNIAVYTDASGTIGIAASTAINAGSIQSGISGTQGSFIAFPPTVASGTLRLVAQNNAGDTITAITNASMGQATTLIIPDPGVASANFLLNSGSNALQAGSNFTLSKVAGTEAANAITLDGQAGIITTSSLTAPAGTKYLITWTNSYITATSVINLFWMGGTNSIGNLTFEATAGVGTSTITIFNNSDLDALNGTLLLGFTIF